MGLDPGAARELELARGFLQELGEEAGTEYRRNPLWLDVRDDLAYVHMGEENEANHNGRARERSESAYIVAREEQDREERERLYKSSYKSSRGDYDAVEENHRFHQLFAHVYLGGSYHGMHGMQNRRSLAL